MYRAKRGSLSPSRRLEQAVARVCHLITVAAGIKKDGEGNTSYSVADFMPHEDGYAELNEEMSIDDLFKRAASNDSE